jgi:hypothetical protein
MRYLVPAAFAVVLSLVVASPLHAQSSQANPNSQKPKKQANQVPEAGPNDPVPDSPFERAIDNVQVTVRPDGTIVAELDDSFLEASTVSIASDGSLQYEHFTGVANAEAAVKRQAMAASPHVGLLPSRPIPFVFPVFLEDKE